MHLTMSGNKAAFRLKEFFSGFVSALRTLTIFPIPGKETANLSDSLYWFPLVGLILGSVIFSLIDMLALGGGHTWHSVNAFFAVLLGVIFTGGLHLDGLADWADSLGAKSGDKNRALEIMKDSRTGAFATIAIVIVLLGKWIFLTHLFSVNDGYLLIGAFIISRTMMVELATTLKYARPEGGIAKPFMAKSGLIHRVCALMFSAALMFVFFNSIGLVMFTGVLFVTEIFGYFLQRRYGGVTGDLLGAACELSEIFALMLACFF